MEMKQKDVAELLLLAALWGASFLFIRYAVPDFGPFALIMVRVVLASVLLLPILMLRKQLHEFRANWLHSCCVGLFSSAIPFVLFAFAMMNVSSGFAAILNTSTPIWGAIIAYFWLGDKLTYTRMTGLFIGVVGVMVLVWGKLDFGSSGLGWSLLAVIGATVFYGISASYAKRFLKGVPPLVTAAGSQIGSSVALFPLGLLFWPEVNPSQASWIAAIILGFVSTGFAYILYFRLIERVGPTNAITVTYLIPLFAAVWGYFLLDESVTLRMILGAGTIFLGTALATGLVKFGKRTPSKES
ncbi:DMT family transporter [Enterovibrio norvegicus]|uniref:DMT family transporter n=1 Tax=Enterovibrio norvegicus TaxID=188144 RepID=UPI0013D4680D|nr:DMT family transporter [Enterovibrio norvegicus]